MTANIKSFINVDKLAEYTSQCIRCEECLEVCCTHYTTQDERLSPMTRLDILSNYFENGTIAPENTEAVYLCTDCGRCDTVCPETIPVSKVIADAKAVLVERGAGPLDKHNQMTAAILKNRNAVNGNSEKRLDWIPEQYRDRVKFEDAPGDTLLYVGCLSAFVDKQTAAASFEILMAAGLDFKIMKDEFCCGIYPYNAGKLNEAKTVFAEMADKFHAAGVKRIIVPCAGCHRAFSAYYPTLLDGFDIKVLHISEVISNLIAEKKLRLSKKAETVTFHDACKTGRKYGLYEQPRAILASCGYEIEELGENRENGLCCGSGSGVRSLNPALSMKIAEKVLAGTESKQVVSTCPFCIFNFNYTARKKELNKKALHIATLVQACLE